MGTEGSRRANHTPEGRTGNGSARPHVVRHIQPGSVEAATTFDKITRPMTSNEKSVTVHVLITKRAMVDGKSRHGQSLKGLGLNPCDSTNALACVIAWADHLRT
jgi:hypothetical protein